MVLQAQSLLTSLVANAVFGNHGACKGTKDEADEEVATVEVGGVEIIVKNGHDGHAGHAHAVYPHFDDRPRDNITENCGSHCHVSYPVFDCSPPDLICESVTGDAYLKHEGIEIIATDDTRGHCTHAVYPHFGDRPEGSEIVGSHAVYSVLSDNPNGLICDKVKNESRVEASATATYPVLGDDSDGLICNSLNHEALTTRDEFLTNSETEEEATTVEAGGIEIIIKNSHDGLDGHAHAVYPHFGDKPKSLIESCGSHCHVAYPVFDSRPPDLICENVVSDAVLKHEGVEIIARDDPDGNCTHAVYPHFGDRPEVLGSHTVYSVLSDNPSGLICEEVKSGSKVKDSSVTTYPGLGGSLRGLICDNLEHKSLIKGMDVEILTSNGIVGGDGEHVLGSHAVYSAVGDSVHGLIGENINYDTVIEKSDVEGHGPENNSCGPHSVSSVLGGKSVGLIGEKDNDGMGLKNLGTCSKLVCNTSKTPLTPSLQHAHTLDQRLAGEPHPLSSVEKEANMAMLVKALTAIPTDQAVSVMQAVMGHIATTSSASFRTCTGCGDPSLNHIVASVPQTFMPTVVAAA